MDKHPKIIDVKCHIFYYLVRKPKTSVGQGAKSSFPPLSKNFSSKLSYLGVEGKQASCHVVVAAAMAGTAAAAAAALKLQRVPKKVKFLN